MLGIKYILLFQLRILHTLKPMQPMRKQTLAVELLVGLDNHF
jgi:hypothetical protein